MAEQIAGKKRMKHIDWVVIALFTGEEPLEQWTSVDMSRAAVFRKVGTLPDGRPDWPDSTASQKNLSSARAREEADHAP